MTSSAINREAEFQMSQIDRRAKGSLPRRYASSESGMKAVPERKWRVCCFCEQWESGGIESFLNNVLIRMDLSQLEIDIVAARLSESVFTEPLKAHGVHFYELSGRQNEMTRNHQAFRKLLKERGYDVVHLHVFQGLSLAYAHLAKEAGVPVRIAHSHNTDLRKSPTRWLKLRFHEWGRKRYEGDCTRLWACSGAAARFLFSSQEYQFIPNGIETERFRFDPAVRAQVRAELGLGDAFVIGNVGRLCAQKNQMFLAKVFRELLALKPNSRLLLVGEGEDLPALKERTEQLQIADKVIFYGLSDHVEQLLWAMDAFVFPSLFEGLGIVAIEAQAAGLPVLCAETVPPEAMVTEQAVQLELSAGPKAWAEAALSMKAADRVAGVEAVSAAGFDAGAVAEKVKAEWMRRSN